MVFGLTPGMRLLKCFVDVNLHFCTQQEPKGTVTINIEVGTILVRALHIESQDYTKSLNLYLNLNIHIEHDTHDVSRALKWRQGST